MTNAKLLAIFLLPFLWSTCNKSGISQSTEVPDLAVNTLERTNQEVLAANDTLYLDHEFLIIGEKGDHVDLIREGKATEITSRGDTLYADKRLSILGDGTRDVEIFIKYHPKYEFDDFPSTVYQGALAKPDFNSNLDAKRFISRVTQGSKNRPNFAGNLNYISWGCGTSCQSGVILDSQTGVIYDGLTTELGFDSRPNSRLLIANYGYFEGRENEWLPFCGYCLPEFYFWDEKKQELVLLTKSE